MQSSRAAILNIYPSSVDAAEVKRVNLVWKLGLSLGHGLETGGVVGTSLKTKVTAGLNIPQTEARIAQA